MSACTETQKKPKSKAWESTVGILGQGSTKSCMYIRTMGWKLGYQKELPHAISPSAAVIPSPNVRRTRHRHNPPPPTPSPWPLWLLRWGHPPCFPMLLRWVPHFPFWTSLPICMKSNCSWCLDLIWAFGHLSLGVLWIWHFSSDSLHMWCSKVRTCNALYLLNLQCSECVVLRIWQKYIWTSELVTQIHPLLGNSIPLQAMNQMFVCSLVCF